MQCAVCSAQCAVYSVKCAVCSVHSSLLNVKSVMGFLKIAIIRSCDLKTYPIMVNIKKICEKVYLSKKAVVSLVLKNVKN